ncbi:hypothetical protein ABVT39_027328 [Epinephelus coioides]
MIAETVVKTIRREPDVTLLCSNATLSTITLIVCRISTEMSRGEECRLLYRFGGDFVRECDSRFTLTEENQTVFLHLTDLTPVDSGDYTCECSHAHGTDKIHLSVTVEGEEEGSTSITILIYTAVICCAAGLITITGVVLGLTLRKCYCRLQTPVALLLRVLTSMGQWKLWFILLLQLTVSVDSKENGQQLVKTIGRESDVTPICTNATEHVIILILCWIRTERSGEECRLLYLHGEDFVHKCDSRFTLLEKNQTVFLHVTSLTPADSGNYTCQCSHTGGTDTLRMNFTVEDAVQDQPHLDYLKLLALWMEMTQMTPTLASSSRGVTSTKVSQTQPTILSAWITRK